MMLAATIMLADTTPAAATAATTPARAATAAPAKDAAKATGDRVVCKTEVVTGSMFPKKTCYSTKDFAQRQQEERANLQKMQEQSH
ncbi:MAG: hypothetical protein ACXWKN_10060 [Phenylobacterium sp.]